MWILNKFIKSFRCAVHGLKGAYIRDQSFRIEIWCGLFLIAFGYIFWPLSPNEIIFIFLAFALILISELLNTAIELAWERLHPERHELVGISKDIASAAVFAAIIFAGVVVLVIALDHLDILF